MAEASGREAALELCVACNNRGIATPLGHASRVMSRSRVYQISDAARNRTPGFVRGM